MSALGWRDTKVFAAYAKKDGGFHLFPQVAIYHRTVSPVWCSYLVNMEHRRALKHNLQFLSCGHRGSGVVVRQARLGVAPTKRVLNEY